MTIYCCTVFAKLHIGFYVGLGQYTVSMHALIREKLDPLLVSICYSCPVL